MISSTGAAIPGAQVTWIAWDRKDLEWEPAWQADDWGPLDRMVREATTGPDGSFAFEDEVFGEAGTVLWATHAEHEAACVLLEPDQELTPAHATVQLGPSRPIRVRVLDAGGNPMSGAVVEHFGITPARASRGLDGRTPERALRLLARHETTDSSGSVTCGPFPGEQILVARAGASRSAPWRGTRQDEVVLRLTDTFTIGGSVRLPDWSHLGYEGERRLVIRARRGGLTETLHSVRPIVEGAWGPLSLPWLDGAEYELELSGSPIVPLMLPFRAPEPGAHLTLDLSAQLGHSLTFQVQDVEGRPIGEAEVASYWDTDAGERVLRRRAESDGRAYNWSFPPEVVVRTFVTAPGHAGQWCYPIRIPENPPATHRVVLEREALLRGRCTHAGVPLADFEVVVWVPGQSGHTQVARSFRGRSDGLFEMDGVPAGKVQVTASTGELPFCRPRSVELPSVGVVELQLEAPIVGSGQVVDLRSGEPIEGARIQVQTLTAEAVLRPWGPAHGTDRDGRFSIPGFLSGRSQIRVRAEGFAERDVQAVSRGDELDFGRIGLYRPQPLEIRLVSDGAPTAAPGLTAEGAEGTLLPRRPFDARGVLRYEAVGPGATYLLLEGTPSPTWTYVRLDLQPGREWSFAHAISGARRLRIEVTGGEEERRSFRGLSIGYLSRAGVHTVLGVPFPSGDSLVLEGIDADRALVTVLGATGPLTLIASAELAGDELLARLDLDGDPFVLRVVDAERLPIAGVSVRVSDTDPGGLFLFGLTDGEGRCFFRGVPARELLVSLEHESIGRALTIPVDGASGEVELVFEASGELDLRILDGDLPLAGVQAKALVSPVGPRWGLLGASDADGVIRAADLAESSYQIVTEHEDCWPASVTATATSTPSPIRIQVRRRGGLSLRLGTPEGAPLVGRRVELRSLEFSADVQTWIDGHQVLAPTGLVSDAAGEIYVERLPRGPYSYRLPTSSGELLEGRCEVLAGALARVVIVVP